MSREPACEVHVDGKTEEYDVGKRLFLMLGGALVLACLVAGAIALASPTRAGASTGPQPVKPGYQQGTHHFYTQSQVPAAWNYATATFPEALPKGVHFSKTAPSFFYPTGGQAHVYETGMPEQFAARFWRCAWLDVAISAKESSPPDTATAATAESELAKYGAIPAVAATLDVKSYLKGMADYAKRVGLDPEVAEFQTECTTYTTGATNNE